MWPQTAVSLPFEWECIVHFQHLYTCACKHSSPNIHKFRHPKLFLSWATWRFGSNTTAETTCVFSAFRTQMAWKWRSPKSLKIGVHMRLISGRLKLCCKKQSLLFGLLCMSFNPLPLTYTKSAQILEVYYQRSITLKLQKTKGIM